MKYSLFLSIVSLLLSSNIASAATIPASPWTTLTPTATIPDATSDYGSFGFEIVVLETGSVVKRDVSQIDDGQLQVGTAVTQIGDGQIQAGGCVGAVTQIGDGQIQAAGTAAAVTQIGDGQIQAAATTAAAVTQIGDGQIQAAATTAAAVTQIGDGQIQAAATTAAAVTQIGDGQIQAAGTAAAVTQIGDGQIQAAGTAAAVTQIGDGQIQAAGTAAAVTQIGDGQIQAAGTAAAVTQIGDGQIQAAGTAAAVTQIGDGQIQAGSCEVTQISDGQIQGTGTPESGSVAGGLIAACVSSDAVVVTLKGGILYDSHGRVGSIVANRQFQFDGPPPQAGAIYAGGWSIVPASYVSPDDGSGESSENGPSKLVKRSGTGYKLALGTQTTFYRCKSGDFYNLYDESIGAQCGPVEIAVFQAVVC